MCRIGVDILPTINFIHKVTNFYDDEFIQRRISKMMFFTIYVFFTMTDFDMDEFFTMTIL